MKVASIEAIPYSIPYTHPLRFASGEVTHANNVVIKVTTQDGVVGVAEAPPRPYTYGETQASIVAVVRDLFAPAIVGSTLLQREQAHQAMARTIGNPTAKAAIDMAMWDALGRTLGQSVSSLLGGFTDRMRVSHMLGFESPERMVAEAERMKETYGISTFKVKVGRRPVDLDVAVCRALRTHFGDTIELYIDGNRGWTAAESAQALDAMADLGLTLAEELNPADDVLGRRWLVERTPMPFVADESVPTPADITREILAGSATAVSIKTARTGFTTSHRILGLVEGLGIDVVMGNQIDGQIGTNATVTFGAAFERTSRRAGELSNFLDISDDLLTEPLRITNGELIVREGPGVGVDLDDDKLAHYRIDV